MTRIERISNCQASLSAAQQAVAAAIEELTSAGAEILLNWIPLDVDSR